MLQMRLLPETSNTYTNQSDELSKPTMHNNYVRPVAGLECMTTGSVSKRPALSHHTSRQNNSFL